MERHFTHLALFVGFAGLAGCAGGVAPATVAVATPPSGLPRTAAVQGDEAPKPDTAPSSVDPEPRLAAPVAPWAPASALGGLAFGAQPNATEPLPPLTAPLVEVTLPKVGGRLVSVTGRGPGDLWFVSDEEVSDPRAPWHVEEGMVIHSDGKRVLSSEHPCGGSYFHSVVASKTVVAASGLLGWVRGIPPNYRAHLGSSKSWTCDQGEGETFQRSMTVAAGDDVWELDCTWGCRLSVRGGPPASLPSFDPSYVREPDPQSFVDHTYMPSALWMLGRDEGWMTHDGGDGREWLLRYNGATWAPVAKLEPGLAGIDLWADGASRVWITARRGGKDDEPANKLLVWDGRSLGAVPVPASFATRLVRGTGPSDVWFVGAGMKAYQWDGQRLHEGEAPFDAVDAWAAPGGEVWLVGGVQPGTAARTAAASAPAPGVGR